jgi:lysophospholipase L1-like esterase
MIHHNAPAKLLVRGGSIAAGTGVEKCYVEIVKDFCSSRNVEVINLSAPGDNSFDGIRTFQKDIEPCAPDILLIHFGVDDAFFPVYRSEFKENLVRMVRSARKSFNPLIMLPTSHTFDDPYEMDAINIYYRTIREVCIDLDCEMVAVHTYWAGYLEDHGLVNAQLVQKDTRLPNEPGHEIFAKVIIHRLERTLA